VNHYYKEKTDERKLERTVVLFMEKCSKLDRVHYGAIDLGHESRADLEGPGESERKWSCSKALKTSKGRILPRPTYLMALQTCPVL
jgi:hypothetical protein